MYEVPLFNVVPCGHGWYKNVITMMCEPCDFGWYQDLIAEEQCKRCESGTTTYQKGASSKDECKSK